MKFRIKYRRIRVTVEGRKFQRCLACGAKGRTEMHHYRYFWKTEEVRKNPQCALDDTIELCYPCHRLADALRKLCEHRNEATLVQDALMKIVRMRKHEQTKNRGKAAATKALRKVWKMAG